MREISIFGGNWRCGKCGNVFKNIKNASLCCTGSKKSIIKTKKGTLAWAFIQLVKGEKVTGDTWEPGALIRLEKEAVVSHTGGPVIMNFTGNNNTKFSVVK